MRALLDISVLIALFDEEHLFNQRAHQWLENESHAGWASCPLTENGLARILCNPNYSRKLQYSAGQILEILHDFTLDGDHQFWPDDLTLRDSVHFDAGRILGPRAITDIYLLALACRHQGRLVTFDEGINLSAVPSAKAGNLCVIP